jgi:4-hydroxy-tetrahydrodipicolinate synthase
MKHLFTGTGVALVTPFDARKNIDYPALERLINQVIAGGVDYLVALGTTAETPTLQVDEKKEILSFILEKNAGRVPVVCGMGGNDTAAVVRQLQAYDLTQAAGILSVGPYYNKPTQEGFFQHFKTIAEATDKPMILYNVPGRTGSNILPATAIRLATAFKNIVAIKEASGHMAQCMELIQNRPSGFAVLSGDDALTLPQIAVGFDGVISVAANCFSKDFAAMVKAALQGHYDWARSLHYKLLTGIDFLFAEGNPGGVKYVLSRQHIIQNELRLPLVPISNALAQKIDAYLASLG